MSRSISLFSFSENKKKDGIVQKLRRDRRFCNVKQRCVGIEVVNEAIFRCHEMIQKQIIFRVSCTCLRSLNVGSFLRGLKLNFTIYGHGLGRDARLNLASIQQAAA